MLRTLTPLLSVALMFTAVACGDDDRPPPGDGGRVDGGPARDGGTPADDGGTPADDGGAPSDASTSCGTMTCGASQYCHIMCTCCGIPTGDGGPAPSADYECRPVPASCAGGPLCSCAEVTSGGGFCDEAARSVSIPCA